MFSACACGKNASVPADNTAPVSAETPAPAAASAPAAQVEANEKPLVEKDGDVIVINVSEKGSALIDKLIESGAADVFTEENFEKTKADLVSSAGQTFPEVETKANRVKETIDGSDYYVLSSGENCDNIIYYIHGGSWVYGVDSPHVTFCDGLISELNSKVYMPMYPLGSDRGYEDAYKMILDLYDRILEEAGGKQVFLIGDSAGGNISLGLLHLIKESGRKMPDKVVLLHPAADMTFTNPDMLKIEPTDPLLRIYGCSQCAKMWSKGADLSSPVFSAVNADVSGYPPTMLFVGTRDILCPDGIILYNNMKAAGDDVTLVRGEGLFHVFQLSSLPEGSASAGLITEFCKAK